MTYDIHTDIKYMGLELIDGAALAAQCTEPWWNQSLCRVNDCVVRLGVFHGEFHWHKHDNEDEFFHVMEGLLLLDIARSADFQSAASVSAGILIANEERLEKSRSEEYHTVELAPGQGMMVPRGAVHRTRAEQRTVVLMIEGAGVVPTGDR